MKASNDGSYFALTMLLTCGSGILVTVDVGNRYSNEGKEINQLDDGVLQSGSVAPPMAVVPQHANLIQS